MLKEEEPLIQRRQSEGLLEKGSEIDGRYISLRRDGLE
jgi:hypothetical protein